MLLEDPDSCLEGLNDLRVYLSLRNRFPGMRYCTAHTSASRCPKRPNHVWLSESVGFNFLDASRDRPVNSMSRYAGAMSHVAYHMVVTCDTISHASHGDGDG